MKKVTMIIPPRLDVIMIGVERLTRDAHKYVTLFYLDGTTDSAEVPLVEWMKARSFIEMVDLTKEKIKAKTELAVAAVKE